MDEYMDTVDPRVERAFTKTGRHRHVHPAKHIVRWGVGLTVSILIISALMVWA